MHIVLPRLAGASTEVLGSVSVVALLLAGLPAPGSGAEPVTASGSTTESVQTSPVGAHTVADGPVAPQVREVPVPEPDATTDSSVVAQSGPQAVEGFGVVGATWKGVRPNGVRLVVRTRTGGTWSPWTELHGGEAPATDGDGHGPNPDSPEAARTRVGTDPLAIGEVDAVQLRATGATPQSLRDLELSVIDPGRSVADDASADPSTTVGATGGSAAVIQQAAYFGATSNVASRGKVAPGVRAPRPLIRSRASWGAVERMRSSAPRYGRVKAGFVHHTVNANDYSRSDVPAIIRGIYAYHTQSLGWSDIGYNFLIDKFGRKWVGRAGGKRRAVIGAHTYGYNHLSTGIAAIGNFETRKPSKRVQRAFGRVLGWKLGQHGVRVGGKAPRLEGEKFRKVNGHRDGGQTACPGINLYRKLPAIRRIAIRRQQH